MTPAYLKLAKKPKRAPEVRVEKVWCSEESRLAHQNKTATDIYKYGFEPRKEETK